ncbi:hypothetical protein [Gimesia chilikensis]|nr:hypothetical protein [Gimesia chilikensis]QDT88342.1 hypothetical protein MalM14_60390 [Gimesia chilikensis]
MRMQTFLAGRTESVEIRSIMQDGKSKRFHCGAGQLLGLRLD